MENYGYIKSEKDKKIIKHYISNSNIQITFINSLKDLNEHSTLYIDSLCSFGNTVYQILNVFFELHYKNINILTYNDNYLELNSLKINILKKLLDHEKNNINNRLSKSNLTLQKKAKKAGRHKGRKTKSIFDKHKKTIFNELLKKTTKVKILSILKNKDTELKEVTPQALGQYIKRKENEKNDRERKKMIKNFKLYSKVRSPIFIE